MVRKLVSATVSTALCMMSAAPALAQDYRGYDAPRGATATLNLRVPLGTQRHQARATYGLTLGYGQTLASPTADGTTTTRAIRLADLRFSGRELRNARVASFDLANLDRDRRMNLVGTGSTTWIVVGVIAGAVAVCLLADCFGGDDEAMPN